jgi:8-oxo-dGTP diphosphatase
MIDYITGLALSSILFLAFFYEFRGEIENCLFKEVRWVKLEDLTNYDFLVADRGLIKDLAAGKLL